MGPLSQRDDTVGLLEVLNRSGQVDQRIAVAPGRITVGRALDNDVILDDPYVCPHHLALEVESGHVTLEDLDSVNGTLVNGELAVFD